MSNLFPTDWDLYEYSLDVSIEFPLRLDRKETYELSNFQIVNLMIEKNYDEDLFPVLMVDLMLPRSVYYKIIQNGNAKIILNVYKFIKENTGMTHKETIIREKFTPVITDDGGDMNSDLYKSMKSNEGLDTDDITASDMSSVYTFILVIEDDIKQSKVILNTILADINITTAIVYILQKSGFAKTNILMSPVDNTDTYKELLLLPMPIIDQFHYISNMYGIYKEGLLFFKDFSMFYILRKTGKCTAYRRNEPKTVIFTVISKIGSGTVSNGVSYDKSNNQVYMNLQENQLSVNDTSSVISKTSGMNNCILQVETGEIIDVSINEDAPPSMLTTISHNKYIKDEMELRKKELSHIISITIDDIDISLLSPNKEYKFITDVSDMRNSLAGTYRISKVQSVFKKEDDIFKCTTMAILKRTSDR